MDKVLLKIFLIFSFFLLFLIVFVSDYKKKKEEEYYRNEEYKAIVIKKYIENNNHGNAVIDILENKDTISISTDPWPYIWKYAEIGDSLIKLSDTLILTINKREGEKIVIKYKNESNNFFIYILFFTYFSMILFKIMHKK